MPGVFVSITVQNAQSWVCVQSPNSGETETVLMKTLSGKRLYEPRDHRIDCTTREREGAASPMQACTSTPLFLHFLSSIPCVCVDSAVVVTSSWCFSALKTSIENFELRVARRVTDLEDIGDSGGVLGSLALGGNDGDGRPGHGGYRGRCPVLVVCQEAGPIFEIREAAVQNSRL